MSRRSASTLKLASRLALMTLGALVVASGQAQAATPGGLYETFAGVQIAGLDLSNSSLDLGHHHGNATNVTAGGGFVYWQDGLNIYRANPDLSGATLWHANGALATDIAVGDHAFYQTFGGGGIEALDLSDSGPGLGHLPGNATNVTVGGGFAYWQDGIDIYRANEDLSGAVLWHINGAVATDIAVGAAAFYETFEGAEIASLDLSNSYLGLGYHPGNATNAAVGGGFVYWQDGLDIYRGAEDLSGAVLWHSGSAAPTDIALLAPAPEPATWALMLAGFALAGARLRRRWTIAV